MIRKAQEQDLGSIAKIYEHLHDQEEAGEAVIGWARGVYPTEETARGALLRGDLFVMETEKHRIVGAAIINRIQVDVYEGAHWRFPARDDEVMVLHTLTIDPNEGGKGYGKAFVRFYEEYAGACGCKTLRMDTNERNARARAMYCALGYTEADIRPTVFNGIPGVNLVLLEKRI